MNVHEYQAKAILCEFGVPVPRGKVVLQAPDAARAAQELGGPAWIAKAQIHAGGRGKGRFREPEAGPGGGVRIAKSVPEVASFASQMLGRTLVTAQTGPAGRQVRTLYLEAAVGIAREFYLSLLVDRALSRAVFVASQAGGIHIEEVARQSPDRIVTVPVDPATDFMPHHGRTIASALGLTQSLASQAEKLGASLYDAFLAKDMALLEINPLILTAGGELLCLDAKISFDDNALYRHPEISALRDESEEDAQELEASKHELNYIALPGTIGCMVNGAGLAMATMDIIKLYGAEPANFLDVGGNATQEKVTAAFKIITADRRVKGILVNIFGGIMKCDVIASGILAAIKETGLSVPLVVRLAGTNADLGKEIIARSGLNVIAAADLDDAAQKIVAAAGTG
ncbi:MAG: ADP-forming succinate--CoA ligase subunit beta [Methylocapsa sp.]|nr:ADP-forming succinate--CoA ligase subunit beta [Methylocapsa sp.]